MNALPDWLIEQARSNAEQQDALQVLLAGLEARLAQNVAHPNAAVGESLSAQTRAAVTLGAALLGEAVALESVAAVLSGTNETLTKSEEEEQ